MNSPVDPLPSLKELLQLAEICLDQGGRGGDSAGAGASAPVGDPPPRSAHPLPEGVPRGERDLRIDAVEKYTSAFDRWFQHHGAALAALPETERATLSSLVKLHERILTLAESMRESTAVDIRHLKAKGKGIMAYVDTLPKRISRGPTRKG